jgi:hypothetical protein
MRTSAPTLAQGEHAPALSFKWSLRAWAMFVLAHLAFVAWDSAATLLAGDPRRYLECWEPRTWPLYPGLALAVLVDTRALRGAWGTLLRMMGLLAQLWFAALLATLLLEELMGAVGPYLGTTCGDI